MATAPLPTAAALAALVLVAAAPARAAGGPEAEVLSAVRRLDALLVAKDAAGLRSLLLDDFVGAVPAGTAFRRDEYVAYHCRPGEGLLSVELDPAVAPIVRVRDGRFAVVNRRVLVRRRLPDGGEIPLVVQRIEVLVREGGAWRLAAGQGTAVQPPPGR
jgi:hypothetical protein